MPLAPGLGYKSYILFAKETTYGTTPAAAIAKWELLSISLNANLTVSEDPSLSSEHLSRRFIGQAGQYVSGTCKVRLNYEGHEALLRCMFGSYVGGTLTDGARDHTFKESATAVLDSFSMDVSWGDVPTGHATRFAGCYMTGLRFAGTAGSGEGAMLTAEFDFVAKSATEDTSTLMTGGTFPDAYGIMFHQLLRTTGNYKDGSGATTEQDIMLKSFTLAITVPHNTTRFYFGSVNAESPIRNGPLDATFTFEEEWNSVLLMQKARLNTMTGLKLLFQHPALLGTATHREFEIIANSPTAASYSTEITGFDAVTQSVSYRLAYNTGDASFAVIRTRNGQAALA